MNKTALHVPINTVSFGQTCILILRCLYDREKAGNPVDFQLFPVGGVDLGANDNLPADFAQWINQKIISSYETYNRNTPVFKLWHLEGSLESLGKSQSLLTFYELDRPTKIELNIAKNNKIAFTNKFTCDNVFEPLGIKAEYIPLAFDSYSFHKTNKKYHNDGRIVFNLCGKFEKRKHHAKVIQTWIKKFGNNAKYSLQCATYNGFLNPQQNNQLIGMALEGKPKPFNVEFFPAFKENSMYNDLLNSANIIIGMSGGEGWGLPEFQSVALGKHAVILNAHGYKSWANGENSVLVSPSGKISAVDNIFFRDGHVFNQGNIFDWSEDDFIFGCEEAIKRYEESPENKAGLKLQEEFSKERFVDNVLAFTAK